MANKALASVDTIDVVNASTNIIVESGGSIKRTSAKNLTAGIADGLLAEVGVKTQDLMSYGVSWDTAEGKGDPICTRTGNMLYHKELPIQNNMRGCIAQCVGTPRIMYYLNPNDWAFRADTRGFILKDKTITATSTAKQYTITDDAFGTIQYSGCIFIINNIICVMQSINTTTKTATVFADEAIAEGTYDVQLGAVLNGYDGEVMVEVPEFWIKSWSDGTKREVRISPTKIDDTWEHQPRMLVGAYRETLLNTAGTAGQGYYSTFAANTGMCVANSSARFGGGSDGTKLGYPRTNVSRTDMRTYVRKAGKELLSYKQYKNLYWLYVIEYANFNSQAEFSANLTSDGYRQGGLGAGVTNFTDAQWKAYNNYNPIVKRGQFRYSGNNTNRIKTSTTVTVDSTTSTIVSYVPYWHGIEQPFGDIYTNLDGVIIDYSNKITVDGVQYVPVYATDNPSYYSDTDISKMDRVGLQVLTGNIIKEFDLGSTAEIIPTSVQGSATLYKCDSNIISTTATSLNTLLVGGSAADGAGAGLGCFRSGGAVSDRWSYGGFRSCCVLK